jgi:hypothetical protein
VLRLDFMTSGGKFTVTPDDVTVEEMRGLEILHEERAKFQREADERRQRNHGTG